MPAIKTSLEIALERAAAMAAQAEDNSEEEAREAGLVAARKVLNGQIGPERLAGEIGALSKDEQGPALSAAAEKVLEALMAGNDFAALAVDNLAEAFGAREEAGRLRAAAHLGAQAQALVQQEVAERVLAELAEDGIGGEAIVPNPLAHPEFEQMLQEATAEASREMRAAGAAFIKAVSA